LTSFCKDGKFKLNFDRNIAYLGLAYQTYKGLHQLKDVDEKTKGGVVMSRELREEVTKTDESMVRLLMKWYYL
jgi:hypothetical protein